jgi:hypothetical protein
LVILYFLRAAKRLGPWVWVWVRGLDLGVVGCEEVFVMSEERGLKFGDYLVVVLVVAS